MIDNDPNHMYTKFRNELIEFLSADLFSESKNLCRSDLKSAGLAGLMRLIDWGGSQHAYVSNMVDDLLESDLHNQEASNMDAYLEVLEQRVPSGRISELRERWKYVRAALWQKQFVPNDYKEHQTRRDIAHRNNLIKDALQVTAAVIAIVSAGYGVFFFVKGHLPVPPKHWQTLVQETTPTCDDPAGSNWVRIGEPTATEIVCSPYASTMTQDSSTQYAEINLLQAGGSSTYNQNTFRVWITIRFLDPGDALTRAVVVVQTPPQADRFGGYALSIGGNGAWQLEQILDQTDVQPFENGTLPPTATTSSITVMLQVSQGTLTAQINGQSISSITDSLSNGVVALLVEHNQSPSTGVQFSDFRLDVYQ